MHGPSLSTPSTRKRKSRTTSSTDENSGDDGKKRGRPRVEKQDESAADRRRTQIRMAQRAYRQRKESTLEELRKRVSELTNTMELMNKAFVDYRKRLLGSSLSNQQLHDVRETGLYIESLMTSTRNPSESCPEEVANISRRNSTNPASQSVSESTPLIAEPRNVPAWIDNSALLDHQHGPRNQDTNSVGMGYTIYMQETDNLQPSHGLIPEFDSSSSMMMPALKDLSRNSYEHDFEAFRMDVPETPIPKPLSAPRTFSFGESTFARRLHRSAMEQAFQLLHDLDRRPATYHRVFRLSLMSRDRQKLIKSMKQFFSRGPHELLDQEVSLIHVGGAGTHFPKRDSFGNLQPKPETWHLGIVGPQALALLENAAKENISMDMTVEIAGFEGEWFDPYDVEGYLAEKGIFISASSSFAEAEISIPSSTPSNTSASDSLSSYNIRDPPAEFPGLPFVSDVFGTLRPFDIEQIQKLSVLGIDATNYNSWTHGNGFGFSDTPPESWIHVVPSALTAGAETAMTAQVSQSSDSSGPPSMTWEDSAPAMNYLGGSEGESAWNTCKSTTSPATAGIKKTIILDVAKFLKILTVSGVCLGRTPGYRRADVDRALALASFEAF